MKSSQQRYLAELEARFARLRQQADGLAAARSSMAARERVLTAWCGGLCLLKDSESIEGDEVARKRCQELEELLQHMMAQVPSAVSQMELLTEGPGRPCGTISPSSDPMSYFARLLSLPPLPEAASMTPQQLAALQRDVILEAAVQQHLLQMAEPDQCAAVLLKMQLNWERYFHAVMSLFRCGRPDVFEALAVYNLEELQPNPEGAMQHELVIAERMHLLALTPQQQEAISVGGELYAERMRSILLGRQQVQGMQVCPCSSSSTGRSGSSSDCTAVAPFASQDRDSSSRSGSGSLSSCLQCCCQRGAAVAGSGGEGVLDTIHDRQQHMRAVQQHINKLGGLLRDEAQLRMITWGWLMGCLSWPQVTQMGLICWPYTQRPAVVAKAVCLQFRKQQQQQQQQRLEQQRQQRLQQQQHKRRC